MLPLGLQGVGEMDEEVEWRLVCDVDTELESSAALLVRSDFQRKRKYILFFDLTCLNKVVDK